jgi:hypothetical protein
MVAYSHLLHLSDDVGVFEHALGTEPRVEGGYCADDVGRALVVACREPHASPQLVELALVCARYLAEGCLADGRFRNRLSPGRVWQDGGESGDASGRAIWGIGVAYASGVPAVRSIVEPVIDRVLRFRSRWPRATAYAVLGVAEIARVEPDRAAARALLADALESMPRARRSASWPWPEDRLTYANALLPHGLMLAAAHLGDAETALDALELLAWLGREEAALGRFSFTPVDGWQRGEPRPGFDQQPIEAATMAEACWSAYQHTGLDQWAALVRLAGDWFLGRNDAGVALYDSVTGGCCDGLHVDGRNRNQGAESTIAAIGTLQLVEALDRPLVGPADQAATSPSSRSRSAPSDTSAAPTTRSAAPYVR